MNTQTSTVVILMAVGVFVMAAANALRAAPGAASVRLKADTPGYADGAPPGFSGGFGESGCDSCHFEGAVNAAPGRVTLTGVPERFTPGTAYPITITLSRPEMKMAGF